MDMFEEMLKHKIENKSPTSQIINPEKRKKSTFGTYSEKECRGLLELTQIISGTCPSYLSSPVLRQVACHVHVVNSTGCSMH